MERLRVGAAQLGLVLTSRQLDQFALYQRALAEWNERVNLTAIEGDFEVQVRHFLDSLTIAPLLVERALTSARLVDVGSGAGFPGLPLKLALPGLRLALVEATGKKAGFLQYVVGLLGLADVEVLCGRAEVLAHQPTLRESFDVAVARAVAEMGALTELALPFCRVGGIMVAQKKGDVAAELNRAGRALDVLGGRLAQVREVTVEGLADGRVLAVVEKVAPTPERYPRRPGVPQKRPLQ